MKIYEQKFEEIPSKKNSNVIERCTEFFYFISFYFSSLILPFEKRRLIMKEFDHIDKYCTNVKHTVH